MTTRPTLITIFAPTRRAAYALRDVFVEAIASRKLVLPVGIEATHWISVGEDSADKKAKAKRRA